MPLSSISFPAAAGRCFQQKETKERLYTNLLQHHTDKVSDAFRRQRATYLVVETKKRAKRRANFGLHLTYICFSIFSNQYTFLETTIWLYMAHMQTFYIVYFLGFWQRFEQQQSKNITKPNWRLHSYEGFGVIFSGEVQTENYKIQSVGVVLFHIDGQWNYNPWVHEFEDSSDAAQQSTTIILSFVMTIGRVMVLTSHSNRLVLCSVCAESQVQHTFRVRVHTVVWLN